MSQHILEVKNLSKHYGALAAVDDISFSISEREIFALIGPNGAGKSTTLRMVTTILSPTGGDVLVADHSVHKDPAKVREVISYLPEEAGAYKNLRGIDYLTFMAGLYAKDAQEVKESLEFARGLTGLGNRLNDKISTYSKGMTRKLLLARTVMSKPKLAILDEPTSGLDIINAVEIRKSIKDLASHGMSVLLSSHNMLEIEFLSDRVGIMNKGKLLEVGTPAELKKKYNATNLEEVFLAIVL
ncbi:MAG TPA: ABC transporter ATP-binding protein [Patescibacteria group bacterium]